MRIVTTMIQRKKHFNSGMRIACKWSCFGLFIDDLEQMFSLAMCCI